MPLCGLRLLNKCVFQTISLVLLDVCQPNHDWLFYHTVKKPIDLGSDSVIFTELCPFVDLNYDGRILCDRGALVRTLR